MRDRIRILTRTSRTLCSTAVMLLLCSMTLLQACTRVAPPIPVASVDVSAVIIKAGRKPFVVQLATREAPSHAAGPCRAKRLEGTVLRPSLDTVILAQVTRVVPATPADSGCVFPEGVFVVLGEDGAAHPTVVSAADPGSPAAAGVVALRGILVLVAFVIFLKYIPPWPA